MLLTIISRAQECNIANKIASCINDPNAVMLFKVSWYLVFQSTISKCFDKCGSSQQISQETISDSQSANDDKSLSNVQKLINHLLFEEEPVNPELFINFVSDVPKCNAPVDEKV